MSTPPADNRLFREAVDLAIRLQNDPANPVAIRMVQTWAARSRDHAAAWSRVAEIHGMAGRILSPKDETQAGGISRRTLVMGGIAGVGAAAAGALVIPGAITAARADYMTATGEIRQVTLPDGSAMTLGPASAVALDFSARQRGVQLLAGMAFFDVNSDAADAFAVAVGGLVATTHSAAFDISQDAGHTFLSVATGTVEANPTNAPADRLASLAAGEWMTIADSMRILSQGARDIEQIASWRTGMIVADQETVSAMVARIARWHAGSVFIADPQLGARVVSGVFDVRNPLRALEAVVRPFGAHVRQIGSFATLITRV